MDQIEYNFGRVRIVFIVYLVLWIPYVTVALFLFWDRRKIFPIRGRAPMMALVVGIWLALYGTFTATKSMDERFPCELYLSFAAICIVVIGSSQLARVWLLFMGFEMTIAKLLDSNSGNAFNDADEDSPEVDVARMGLSHMAIDELSGVKSSSMADMKVLEPPDRPSADEVENSAARHEASPLARALAGQPEDNSKPRGSMSKLEQAQQSPRHMWFIKHRDWAEPRRVLYVTAAVAAFLLMPFVVAISADPPSDTGVTDCEHADSQAYFIGLIFSGVMGVFIISYQIREVVDGFGLKKEFKHFSIAAFIGLGIWTVFQLGFRSLLFEVFPFHSLVISVNCFVCFSLVIVEPLYRSVFKPPALDIEVPADINTLEGLLKFEQGYNAFQQHLCAEFSVENLIFYNEVHVFRKEAQRALDELAALAVATEQRSGSSSNLDGAASMNAGRGQKLGKLLVGVSIKEMVVRMYDKFIADHAPFQVNLPAKCRQQLDDVVSPLRRAELAQRQKFKQKKKGKPSEDLELQSDPATEDGADLAANRSDGRHDTVSDSALIGVFDNAQKEIFKLMSRDSYARFCSSRAFEELVETWATQSVQAELNHTFSSAALDLAQV